MEALGSIKRTVEKNMRDDKEAFDYYKSTLDRKRNELWSKWGPTGFRRTLTSRGSPDPTKKEKARRRTAASLTFDSVCNGTWKPDDEYVSSMSSDLIDFSEDKEKEALYYSDEGGEWDPDSINFDDFLASSEEKEERIVQDYFKTAEDEEQGQPSLLAATLHSELVHPSPDARRLQMVTQMVRTAFEQRRFIEKFAVHKMVEKSCEYFNLFLSECIKEDEEDGRLPVHTCQEWCNVQLEHHESHEKGADFAVFSRCNHTCLEEEESDDEKGRVVELFFVFVGTVDLIDHIQDVKSYQKKYHKQSVDYDAMEMGECAGSASTSPPNRTRSNTRVDVYAGPFDAYSAVKENLFRLVGRLWQKYYEKNKTVKMTIAGHSLGGAMCTFFFADLLRKGFKGLECYTLGSPKCGNAQFVRYMEKLITGSGSLMYRCFVKNDIVQTLPPSFKILNIRYQHVGYPVLVEAERSVVIAVGDTAVENAGEFVVSSKSWREAIKRLNLSNLRKMKQMAGTGMNHMRYLGCNFLNSQWMGMRPFKENQIQSHRI